MRKDIDTYREICHKRDLKKQETNFLTVNVLQSAYRIHHYKFPLKFNMLDRTLLVNFCLQKKSVGDRQKA